MTATVQDVIDNALPTDTAAVQSIASAVVVTLIETAGELFRGDCSSTVKLQALAVLHWLATSGALGGVASGPISWESVGGVSRSFAVGQALSGNLQIWAGSVYGTQIALLLRVRRGLGSAVSASTLSPRGGCA